MIVIATDSFLSHRCPFIRQWSCGKVASGLEIIWAEYWLKELQESMDRCTGRRAITEILLKTVLKTLVYVQSINTWEKKVKGYRAT